MAKFIKLEEAAQMLGVSEDELNEARQRQDIYGYRDGASWKFKEEDIEKIRGKLGGGGSSAASDDDLPVDLGDSQDDVVLLSEAELGESGPSASSTIIGKSSEEAKPGSDIIAASDSDLKLAADSDLNLAESDVRLADEGSDVLGPGSSDLHSGTPGKSGYHGETVLTSDMPIGNSSIKLSLGDDDVLSGSDVTSNPGDSGIMLVDPRDSGLNLEEPLDLDVPGGGDGGEFETEAMELPEDDDFLLTPLTDGTEDESDSGSQVIALDEADSFGGEEPTATLLESQVPGLSGLGGLEEEEEDPLGRAASPLAGGAGPAMVGGAVYREAPFGAGTVVGLAVCVVLLAFNGMLMYDLIRNMWSWDQPFGFNSALLDMFRGMF